MFWHPFLRSIAQTPTKRNIRHQLKLSKRLLQTWNGLLRKRSLLLLWKQMYGVFAALSLLIQQATLSLHISWSQSRPKQKTTMEKHTGSTVWRKRRRLIKRRTFSLWGLQSFWPTTLNEKILCLPWWSIKLLRGFQPHCLSRYIVWAVWILQTLRIWIVIPKKMLLIWNLVSHSSYLYDLIEWTAKSFGVRQWCNPSGELVNR